MKFYEKNLNLAILIPYLPIIVRCDGRAFHSFTRGLNRPYDKNLSNLMRETTKFLVAETNADLGYTQSDEISLIWKNNSVTAELFFGGKTQKIISITSALTSTYFNAHLPKFLPDKIGQLPIFDSRVWQVPNLNEAINYLIWREQDATNNSIQMTAQSLYPHKALQNKNCNELQEMISSKGINWNNYPSFFKKGSYFTKQKIKRKYSATELPNHPNNDPNFEVERNIIAEVDILPLKQVENREEILFGDT